MHNTPHIPYRILAFAPFLGSQCPVWSQTPIRIDLAEPDRAIAKLGPACTISIPAGLFADEILELNFKKYKDFHPDTLVQTNSQLKKLFETKSLNHSTYQKKPSKQEINAHPCGSALDKILDMVAIPGESHESSAGPQNAESRINTMVVEVLRHVFHDREFRTIEKSWRGLKLLQRHLKAYDNAVVEIIPISMDSLAETLNNLTAELIEDLPSLIIVDIPLDSSPRSMECMESIARFSETLLAPAVTWISPKFFNLDNWKEIKRLSFLPHYLEEPSFARWQTFRKTSSAKWLTIACNRIMERYPYGDDNQSRLVPFKESAPLWISPVWVIGSLISLSLAKTGCPTQFAHWQEIRMEDLPLDTTDPAKPVTTEVNLNRDRIDQLIRSGIVPITQMQGRDIAFTTDETTAGGSSLSYQLLLSRITQLILWCKDNFEKGLSGDELKRNLKEAFFSYWESTGHSGPDSLEILIDQPGPDNRLSVRIKLEPSHSILPGREKVDMQFFW